MNAPSFASSGLTQDPALIAMAGPESGWRNVPNAAGRSSAYGIWQITEPTFRDTVANDPALAGITHDQFKQDPALQAKVAQSLADGHRKFLRSNGLNAEDNGNIYALWFLGRNGGTKVLQSDPNAPLTSVMSPDQLRANPEFLKFKTAGELRNNLASKVNGGSVMSAPPYNQGGQPPAGMSDYVRQAQALIGSAQPSPELINSITRNNQQKSSLLPLSLGAMLSRDKGMSQFGSTLYEDANSARGLVPVGEEGFVDPQTGTYIENPVGSNKKNQRVLEMSLKLAQQAEDAAARRAQSQQQFETNTLLRQTAMAIAQQGADAAKTNAQVKVDEYNNKMVEQQKIEELLKNDPNTPFRNVEDYNRNAGAVRTQAQKRLEEMREEYKGIKKFGSLIDEFKALNDANKTGDFYDTYMRNSPAAFQLNPDKQRMIQLNSEMQTNAVPSGQGAVSNLERELFGNAVPGLQFKKEANDKAYEAFAKRKQFREDALNFMDDYFIKYGHLNGADQAAEAYLRKKYGTSESAGVAPAGQGVSSGPPPAAIEFLKKNNTPENQAAFKAKYGTLPEGF